MYLLHLQDFVASADLAITSGSKRSKGSMMTKYLHCLRINSSTVHREQPCACGKQAVLSSYPKTPSSLKELTFLAKLVSLKSQLNVFFFIPMFQEVTPNPSELTVCTPHGQADRKGAFVCWCWFCPESRSYTWGWAHWRNLNSTEYAASPVWNHFLPSEVVLLVPLTCGKALSFI